MANASGLTNPQINTKLYGLDHLRALAITLVIVYHYGVLFSHPEWIRTIGKFGWTGVDLFFVLSGYLIASQLFLRVDSGKNILLKEFFIKRFFRIIPAYLFVLTVYFCFPFVREREAPAPLWKYLTFTQNLGLDAHSNGTFSHAWSLCIEEQFYFLLPVILTALVYFKKIKKGYLLLIVLFLFGFAIRWYAYRALVLPHSDDDNFWVYWSKWIYYPTYSRLDGLLTGVSVAALFQFRPLLRQRIIQYGNMLLLLSIFILTGAYFLCLNEQSFAASVFGFPLVSIGYGLMVTGAVSSSSFLYKFNSAITSRIAALSYSIYLSHKILIHITQSQLSKYAIAADGYLMFLICIIIALLGAWMMNKIIEKPFLNLRNKILGVKKL